MDLKLFEDFIALASTRSFVRAAEARHVTHPAFGRRIRMLESWAGAPLVERHRTPVHLTPEGEQILKLAERTLANVESVRAQVQRNQDHDWTLNIGTGRMLARTMVADWLGGLAGLPLSPLHGQRVQIEIKTGLVADLASWLEQGKIDLLCCYEHRSLSVPLNGHRFRHLVLSQEKLVPVSATLPDGRARFSLLDTHQDIPLITYKAGLSMERLFTEHLERNPMPKHVRPYLRCDTADAVYEFVRRGLGIAWLPWSMVFEDCQKHQLTVLGGKADEIPFEVRLYRPRSRQSEIAEAVWSATENFI
ncbi:MAG: LysR family transcriptional regulator [Pigmentiphaga sp.]|nr:LysR family transcriptional regulator [Pigmentiphaga sp.]